jgi:hypothetical protein
MTTVNEGFWDAVVNGVKRAGLAVGAAAGSGKADGKLTALNLSTKFYDEFNHYMGSTGQTGTPDSMVEFMANKLGLSKDFSTRAGTEFERFIQSPSTYPNKSTGGESPMGDQPKKFSDGELRKYFLNVAQTALRTGEARDAARAEMSGLRKSQEPEQQSEPQPNEPEASPQQTQSEPDAETATAEPTKVELNGVNLNDPEQDLLNSIEGQVGIEGVAGLVKADDPDVQKLAKKIVLQALRDYRAKHPSSTQKKK